MRFVLGAFELSLALLWGVPSFAQQPRFPIDQNKIAVGAKETSPEELKKLKAGGATFMLIDVNTREQFARETIPGAVNIPLEETRRRSEEHSQGHGVSIRLQSRTTKFPGGEDRAVSRLHQLDFLSDHEVEGRR